MAAPALHAGMARSIQLAITMSALLTITGCAVQPEDDTAPETDTATSPLTGTATVAITVANHGTAAISPRGLNFAGTVSPTPRSNITTSDFYTESGVGNVSSFHVNYDSATGGKSCHFDVAAFPSGASCTFTKNAQSQGSTFATCTATVTSFDFMTCSQAITFSMQ